MRVRKRSFFLIGLTVVALLIGVTGVFWTRYGSEKAVTLALSSALPQESIDYQVFDGNLIKGVTFNQLVLTNLNCFPSDSVLKVQELFVRVPFPDIYNYELKAANVRLVLPDCDPVVISGEVTKQQVNAKIFSKFLMIDALYPQWLYGGYVRDLNVHVTGDIQRPMLEGTFVLEDVVYKGIRLKNTMGRMKLVVTDWTNGLSLQGTITVTKGLLMTKRVRVELQKSQFTFAQSSDDIYLDVHGSSLVERVAISIALSGSLKNPQFFLSSEPPVDEHRLMLMLATGKRWDKLEQSVSQGELDPETLSRDFLDYFLLGGQTQALAHKLGFSSFSFDYDKNEQSVAVTKSITSKVDLGYAVGQSKDEEDVKQISHKIEGTYRPTKHVTVGVEREIVQTEAKEKKEEEVLEDQYNDRVFVKYKRSF